MAEEFKYILKWSGRKPTPAFLAATAEGSPARSFHIWKDTDCKVIDHERYMRMVKNGLIAPPESWWQIREGELGIVTLSYYGRQYSRTWEELSNCIRDFEAGFEACEKGYQLLRDWDQAIAYNKARDEFSKRKRRWFIMKPEPSKYYRSELERIDGIFTITERWKRDNTLCVRIDTTAMTGEELQELAGRISRCIYVNEMEGGDDNLRRYERDWRNHPFFK